MEGKNIPYHAICQSDLFVLIKWCVGLIRTVVKHGVCQPFSIRSCSGWVSNGLASVSRLRSRGFERRERFIYVRRRTLGLPRALNVGFVHIRHA